MNPISGLFRLLAPSVRPETIRMEIFLLGSRHHGEALKGARQELRSERLEPGRGRLLRAVISHLS